MRVDDQRLNELVGWLVDTAKSTEHFVVEQAPDVARQMIAWGFWGAAFWVGVAMVMVPLGVYLCTRHARICAVKNKLFFAEPDNNDTGIAHGVVSIFAGLLAIGFCIALFDNASVMVKVAVAPKIYLIEQATHLLGK